MNFCCCSLAGTAACVGCRGNTYGPIDNRPENQFILKPISTPRTWPPRKERVTDEYNEKGILIKRIIELIE